MLPTFPAFLFLAGAFVSIADRTELRRDRKPVSSLTIEFELRTFVPVSDVGGRENLADTDQGDESRKKLRVSEMEVVRDMSGNGKKDKKDNFMAIVQLILARVGPKIT